jgi:hypothetical protein
MKNKIYTPSKGADSWKEFLAHPNEHWKTGYSAKTMAHCWEVANGFPKEIRSAIRNSNLKLEMIFAIPEYQVYLDTRIAPSQNDLFVLSSDSNGLAVIMIEGKVSESFNKTIKKWNNSAGKLSRFDFLMKKLELNKSIANVGNLKYQLFHRTVSAILIAEKYFAKKAIMIVHSFSQSNQWFNDYLEFSKLINPSINPKVNEINKIKSLESGIELYVGWVKGDEKYLKI